MTSYDIIKSSIVHSQIKLSYTNHCFDTFSLAFSDFTSKCRTLEMRFENEFNLRFQGSRLFEFPIHQSSIQCARRRLRRTRNWSAIRSCGGRLAEYEMIASHFHYFSPLQLIVIWRPTNCKIRLFPKIISKDLRSVHISQLYPSYSIHSGMFQASGLRFTGLNLELPTSMSCQKKCNEGRFPENTAPSGK